MSDEDIRDAVEALERAGHAIEQIEIGDYTATELENLREFEYLIEDKVDSLFNDLPNDMQEDYEVYFDDE